MNAEVVIKTQELGDAIKRKREPLGWSLREVADVTGISFSTLSRWENGNGKPNADNLARITAWLEMPMERLVETNEIGGRPVIYFPHESTPEIVRAHLMVDPSLDERTAKGLADLFDVAYERFTEKEEQHGEG